MRHVFTPTQESTESGRVILRDGSTAEMRPATPADGALLLDFFNRLSPEARRQRFLSVGPPAPDLVAGMCDNRDPANQTTLLVSRTHGGAEFLLAAGTFACRDKDVAEVAFAVGDAFQGKGLGTILLERLALLASRYGYRRFWALTQLDNFKMREVFQDSGFSIQESTEHGEIEVDLCVLPDAAAVNRLDVRDRVTTVASLRPFFHPNGVAVVGASRNPGSIGFRTLNALVSNQFHGPIYPINPKSEQILGLKCYPSVKDLPAQVDLAILAVPRDSIFSVVDDCAARGVRALVVLTAGFAEVRGEGAELQRQLLRKVRGYGMRMVGPNCLGILNADPAVSLNASFSPVFPPPGSVAMSSQSGALGIAVLAAAKRLNLGFSTFVSVGNKADVSGNDLLQYWEEDPKTDVVLLYLESFGNPQRFARIAQRVSRRKPIVALKAGRGSSGARAAGSHTAALAAKEVAVDALFRQTGIIRAETLEEMFDLAAALSNQPLPAGNRVGIVTNVGGPGILSADACEAGGLTIPEFSAATQERLAQFLPSAASMINPVDMIASATPEQYRQAIETVLTSSEVDALIVIYISVGLGDMASYLAAIHDGIAAARAAGAADIPVLGSWMSDPETAPIILQGQRTVPVYAFPESPGHVLGRIAGYARWRQQAVGVIPEFADIETLAARTLCSRIKDEHGPCWLAADDVNNLLRTMKLPAAPSFIAKSGDEAATFAAQVGFPVAIKLVSRTLVHKTEVGGVQLDLADATAVRLAFDRIEQRLLQLGQRQEMDGVLVQPMIAGGVELMVGVTRDPQFGPLIGFGLGGIHLEVLRDVVFRIAPLTDHDAAEMINSIRGRRLLDEFRGRAAVDIEAIQDVILRVARLVEEVPEIREIDFNPILARERGCVIVDARVFVG